MRTRFWCLMLIGLICPLIGLSQETNKLKTGDILPEITLKNVVNYPGGTLRFTDLKGKLIILDFWNVWCSSCIKSFPKLERLQHEFGDKIQIILVTRDTENKVESLFARSEKARTSLPLVIADTILSQYFPITFPHHVWIMPDGRIKAITDTDNLTDEKLKSVLNGKQTSLPTVEQIKDFDNKQPLFSTIPNHFSDAVEVYSYITSYIPGIFPYTAGASFEQDTNNLYRIAFYNRTILNLLRIAFGNLNEETFGYESDTRRIRVLTDDSLRFFPPSQQGEQDDWISSNSYNYELQVPPKKSNVITEYMQQDLQRFFDISVGIEKELFPCMRMVRKDTNYSLLSKGGDTGLRTDLKNNNLMFSNMLMTEICSWLTNNFSFTNVMIADDTNLKENIDLTISLDATKDFNILSAELSKYGIQFIRGESEFDVLTIFDKNGNKAPR